MTTIDSLVQRWKLGFWIMTKSFYIPHPDVTDEEIYGEVPPEKIVRVLPNCLAEILLASDFNLHVSSGFAGNAYDATRNKAEVGNTNDVLHEIGHALWYNLIPDAEVDKKEAVVHALSEDRSTRAKLDREQLPSLHLEYAALVGAYSGQFLAEEYENERMNDLEEHFARNFDYLMKGKPIVLLPESEASTGDVLAFYRKHGVIDDEFEVFYRKSIEVHHDGKGVHKVPINEMIDGDPISTDLLTRIHELRGSN
jgi:hypothetical protein